MRAILPLLWLTQACVPSVQPAFQAVRHQALAPLGPIQDDWKPDAVVTMSPVLVDLSLRRLLTSHGEVAGELDVGVLRATPTLMVERVAIGPGACPRCLSVDAGLRGRLAVDTLFGSAAAPMRAELSFDAELDVVELDDVWTITLVPRSVRTVDVHVAGTDLSAVAGPVSTWITDALIGQRVPVAELGSAALPIRAVRVRAENAWLRLELLTATHAPVEVRDPDELPDDGWRLDLATNSLLDLARAASLTADPGGHGIVAEPTALIAIDDRFVLHLRLWRVVGRGWWRDYVVHGSLAVTHGTITLTPESVEDVGHSPGAAWADPLAALARGTILKTVERALQTSVPAVHGTGGDALPLELRVEDVRGLGPVIVAHGTLALGEP